MLGLSFKPETDDIRESPAIDIAEALLSTGRFTLRLYDPKAMDNAKRALGEPANAVWCSSVRESVRDEDAVVIATEWVEFRSLNFTELKETLRQPVLFDLRNVYRHDDLAPYQFEYHGTGVC